MSSKTQEKSPPQNKRAQFTEAAPAKSKTKPIMIFILLAFAGVVAYLTLGSANDRVAPRATPIQSDAGQAAGDIRIPLSELNDGKAKFFEYKAANGATVRYFVVKSSDGVYHAALDACEVCFHAKQGYHQEGADMVCNNCNKRFHSIRINEFEGGCHPVGLTRAVAGDYLIVKASELERGGGYF